MSLRHLDAHAAADPGLGTARETLLLRADDAGSAPDGGPRPWSASFSQVLRSGEVASLAGFSGERVCGAHPPRIDRGLERAA
jgi:hypothetical protein